MREKDIIKLYLNRLLRGFPGGSVVKYLPAVQTTHFQSLGQEDLLEKEMATHCSTVVWKIPWTEEPGRIQSMGSQSRTQLSNFTSLLYEHDL